MRILLVHGASGRLRALPVLPSLWRFLLHDQRIESVA
jgi:hypothetical protein